MKYIIIIAVLLGLSLGYTINRYNKLNDKYKASIENIKAYESQFSDLDDANKVFKFTIEQLNYSKDSIIQKLNETRKELGIKDKRLEQLQYNLTHAVRTDTIHIKDTIFKNPDFRLDTIIGDQWFKTRLGLNYPSEIAISPQFKSESFLFLEGKRETIHPPKKFFLSRWLQRKHTVLNIVVKENNPYVEVKEQRFIEVIK